MHIAAKDVCALHQALHLWVTGVSRAEKVGGQSQEHPEKAGGSQQEEGVDAGEHCPPAWPTLDRSIGHGGSCADCAGRGNYITTLEAGGGRPCGASAGAGTRVPVRAGECTRA